ncbi:MAG TPA: hypothetical protein VMW72_03675 [Sedimentisphaerales bacterium]|nr:hypothetical protein [Sedimentisphaerales bacterium]
MANDKKQNYNNINKKDFDDYYKVWKSYEDVAMHFNDLIIRLRIQSIGGLAVLATILGIILHSKNDNIESFNYGWIVLAILCLIWIAIWILDLGYYNRLLEGSVNAILELEKNKKEFLKNNEINLSTNIENAFYKRFDHEPKGLFKRIFNSRNEFYLIVFIALFLSTIFMYWRGCKQKGDTSGINQKVQNVTKDKDRQE